MKKMLAILLAMVIVVVGCSTGQPANTDENSYADVEITAAELLGNVNARKAISMAFDKDYIVDDILNNGSLAANYFVPVDFVSDEEGNDFRDAYPGFNTYDVDKALEYWNLAKEELQFGKVSVEFLTYDSDSAKKMTEFIQAQLQANLPGLTVRINQQPFENKLELGKNGQFDLNLAGWGPDYPDPMTYLDMFVTGGGYNNIGYSNPELDEMIRRAKSGDLVTDIPARWTMLQEVERLMFEDAIIAPVYQRGRSVIAQPYYSGQIRHNFGGDYTFKTADISKIVDGEKVIRLMDTSDIPTMDGSLATDAVSFQAMANVNEGLFMLGEDDVIEAGVATHYEVSEDGLVYTFFLRDNAVWSNGDSVTAEDFVYSFRRLGNPETGAQYAYMLETAGIKNATGVIDGELSLEELGVEALDSYTLQVTLETPVPYFINMMTFPSFYPLNEAFVEAQGDKFGTTVETTLYNGPFTLSKWVIGYEYEYAKNPMYWDASQVKVDRINFRIIKDVATAVNLYENGDIDRVLSLSQEFVDKFKDDPNFFQEGETSLFYIEFNINNR
jgi:ABC-type oligopeptide transport system substrate-binding subunit